MIERLLAADRALEAGDLDGARRLFDQVAGADPRNAIAVVGQAEVARRRGDADEARRLATVALAIDPDEAAAQRLIGELPVEPERAPDLGHVPEDTAVATPAEAAGPVAPPTRGGFIGWIRRLFGRAG